MTSWLASDFAIKPRARAPPILPAPTMTMGRTCAALRASGAALALIDDGGGCLGRRFAGPDHELEGREVTVAGFERGGDQGFALLGRRADGAAQQEAVAIDDLA